MQKSSNPKFRLVQLQYPWKPSDIKRNQQQTLKEYSGASESVLKKIKQQILSCREDIANNHQGLKNITLNALPYSLRCPDTNQNKYFNQVYGFTVKGKYQSEQKNFKGVEFKGKIYFANDHPNTDPKVIMDEIKPSYHFQMIQSYQDGQICLPQRGKKQHLSVTDVLERLESVIYNPEIGDPADVKLCDFYQTTQTGYWNFMKKQAQQLRKIQQSQQSQQIKQSQQAPVYGSDEDD